MPLLVIAGRAELGDPDVPRVQRRDQPLDRTALAGCVPPLEDHADRRAEPWVVPDQAAQYEPQLQQPVLSGGQAGRFLVRGELQAEIQSGEQAALASHAPHLPSSRPDRARILHRFTLIRVRCKQQESAGFQPSLLLADLSSHGHGRFPGAATSGAADLAG
jgi:hypothetical protein